MNARELYGHIKDAARAFGIQFHEMELITVCFFVGGVQFKYGKLEYIVKT